MSETKKGRGRPRKAETPEWLYQYRRQYYEKHKKELQNINEINRIKRTNNLPLNQRGRPRAEHTSDYLYDYRHEYYLANKDKIKEFYRKERPVEQPSS